MTILVTGAAGFIGFHLARRLLDRGDDVVGIDSINDYYEPGLKLARLRELGVGAECETFGTSVTSSTDRRFRFMRLMLEDYDGLPRLFSDQRFDRVVNLAAQAGVRYGAENPRAYLDSNLTGFLNLLECCRAERIAHLVYASSSSVYGLNGTRPFKTEDHTDHPVSLYAATKKANELMAHAYSHLFRIPTTGLRFFTVYGPWGRPDMAYFKFARAIRDGKPIDVYNGGDLLRDFTFIDDIVEGVVKTMDDIPTGDPGWDPARPDPSSSSAPYRVYNIGNNDPVRLDRFIETLENVMGKRAEKRRLPMQSGDVYATDADISALERDFDWKPATGIEEGLASFADWFKSYDRSNEWPELR